MPKKKNLIPLKREREGYFVYDELKAERPYTPERSLLVAMLERGIRDILEPHHSFILKKEAKIWFVSDSVEEFSFLWVMRHLFPDTSEIYSKKILKTLLNHVKK